MAEGRVTRAGLLSELGADVGAVTRAALLTELGQEQGRVSRAALLVELGPPLPGPGPAAAAPALYALRASLPAAAATGPTGSPLAGGPPSRPRPALPPGGTPRRGPPAPPARSSLLGAALTNARASSAAGKLQTAFAANTPARTAVAVSASAVSIAGRIYPATGITAAPGSRVRVANSGRPGVVTYTPVGGTGTTGGATSGSTTTLTGDPYTDAAAYLAIAAALLATTTIAWTADDDNQQLSADVIPGGISHGDLADLSADDHAQYALLAGRAGGQDLYGGLSSSDRLTLYAYVGGPARTTFDGNGFTVSADGSQALQIFATYAAASQSTIIFRRALGSEGSPADVTSGAVLGRFAFQGYVNGAFSGSRALLLAYAAENWTSGAQGSRWGMQSTEAGGTTLLQNWSIDGSGNFRLFIAATTAIGATAKYVLALGAQATRPTTRIADQIQLWNENQQARAGDAALHIWPESANSEYSFGKQLQLGGGLAGPIVAKTSNYTATLADRTILANKATAITITLPTAASAWNSTTGAGQEYYIKNIGAGLLTIDGNGSETIDGELTQSLDQWEAVHIQTDGSAWYIL